MKISTSNQYIMQISNSINRISILVTRNIKNTPMMKMSNMMQKLVITNHKKKVTMSINKIIKEITMKDSIKIIMLPLSIKKDRETSRCEEIGVAICHIMKNLIIRKKSVEVKKEETTKA